MKTGKIITPYVDSFDFPQFDRLAADIFTKALGRDRFEYLLGKLGMKDIHSPA